MHVIETHRLTKRYGDVTALAGIDLRVPPGALFGFLGPNGAGKTTTMRILVGLLHPTGGRADVLGLDSARNSVAIRRRIGYLPGDVRLYEWMTGRRFLSFCDAARGGGAEQEIQRLRTRFDLDLGRRIRDYSRGMKQKLGLISALMHRPELLILDEPTSALDPLVQQTLYQELRSAAEEGRTVLFSSHTLSEVEALCDRIAIIRDGRIIEESTIADLRKRALRRVTLRPRDGRLTPADLPGGCMLHHAADGELSLTWKGEVDSLLRWLTGIDLLDVTIGPPDLESLFAAYYQPPASPAAEGDGR